MDTIQIDGHILKWGNFAPLADVIDDNHFANVLWEMEQRYFTDRKECAAYLRDALESMAYAEYLKLYPQDRHVEGRRLQATITKRIQGERGLNPVLHEKKAVGNHQDKKNEGIKLFLAWRCCRDSCVSLFQPLQNIYGVARPVTVEDVKNVIWAIYGFSSVYKHDALPDSNPPKGYELTNTNLRKYVKLFFFLLKGYCQIYYPNAADYSAMVFSEDCVPLDSYIPLDPSKNSEFLYSMGLRPPKRKSFYVEAGEPVKYYLCGICNRRKNNDREMDVLAKLWAEDNDYDVSNIIRKVKKEYPIDDNRKRVMFALTSRPLQMTPENLALLTLEEKEKIFGDVVAAIRSLHRNIPSLYHRNVVPESFLLFRARKSYKVLLCNFETVKDEDANATVYDVFRSNLENNPEFFAPEIRAMKIAPTTRRVWKLSDYYSVGIMGVYIFTGGTNLEGFLNNEEFPADIRSRIGRMCASGEERSL